MRRLLSDLCGELDGRYRNQARALHLASDYFRAVGQALKPEHYSHWKVVGWIEELNDLVYFLDVQRQLKKERSRSGFAESFLAACDEQFYEHTYLDELFPNRKPEPGKLPACLSSLCTRLAKSVTQESMFLVLGLPSSWFEQHAWRTKLTPFDLAPNFERAELAGWVAIGLEGARVELTHGRVVPTQWLKHPGPRWPCGLALGPTIIYGKDKTPDRIVPTAGNVAERIQRARMVIEQAWPEGYRNLAYLTNRIVPLKAKGVVSFSYRHRPGLSFINCFDRDDLDLIDDLIHENSHHHLNLLLRKAVLYHKDRNQEIFYSPWRRSLRPLRGILHATFTFTMGAILFEKLSTWAKSGKTTLTDQQILRARFRCLEEVASVRYSLKDLVHARRLGWLTPAGWGLVSALKREIDKVGERIAPFERAVLRSKYGRELKRHQKELASARETYGPIRNGS
ncbi:MAG TPA: HEXXH motif-containing putative peptide modification protein [Nitrospiraceae bacterium]|nr:HEXXH motif-containing putative peptide modification protein [Nitrospiraceae bacterium]